MNKNVLEKIYTILMIIGVLFFTVGCTETKIDNVKDASQVDTFESDISIKIKEGTLTSDGITLLIKDNSNYKYTFGDDFYIEKENNGNFEKLAPITENYAFNSIGYVAYENELEVNQNWSYIYGSLTPGKYRLVKTIFKEEDIPVTKEDIKNIHIDFEIR